MNKQQLAWRIAKEHNVDIKDTVQWIDAILSTLSGCILDCDEVTLYGFGTFKKKYRHKYTGRMPDGTESVRGDRLVLQFFPSRPINEALKDGLDSKQYKDRMNRVREERQVRGAENAKKRVATMLKRAEQQEGE